MTRLIQKHRALAGLGAALILALLAVPGASFVYELGGGESCARCHEIQGNFDTWRHSTHKEVACTECHGDALTVDPDFHLGNIRRLSAHLSGGIPEEIRLRQRDIGPMVAGCKRCHEEEFRHWQSGAHSASYARIFLSPAHNNKRTLMDDCLRCHGMHFPGSVADLVSPLSKDGPWLLDGVAGSEAAIPCLSCHAMHVDAAGARDNFFRVAAAEPSVAEIQLRPSLSLFDRRIQDHLPALLLPVPKMHNQGRLLRMNGTPQNALCYQCHAPYANMQVGTDDDKTPLGAFEGISCLDCHEKHTLKADPPCPGFHDDPASCVDVIPLPVKRTQAVVSLPSTR